jgi:hypothetical protein
MASIAAGAQRRIILRSTTTIERTPAGQLSRKAAKDSSGMPAS